jgi:hypothetical protein
MADVIGVSITPFALLENDESRESIISHVCSDGLPIRHQLFRPDSAQTLLFSANYVMRA